MLQVNARREAEIERLKAENARLLEQFVRWSYNANNRGIGEEVLNRPLPAVNRDSAFRRPALVKPPSHRGTVTEKSAILQPTRTSRKGVKLAVRDFTVDEWSDMPLKPTSSKGGNINIGSVLIGSFVGQRIERSQSIYR